MDIIEELELENLIKDVKKRAGITEDMTDAATITKFMNQLTGNMASGYVDVMIQTPKGTYKNSTNTNIDFKAEGWIGKVFKLNNGLTVDIASHEYGGPETVHARITKNGQIIDVIDITNISDTIGTGEGKKFKIFVHVGKFQIGLVPKIGYNPEVILKK